MGKFLLGFLIGVVAFPVAVLIVARLGLIPIHANASPSGWDARRTLEDHVLDADACDFRNARSGVVEQRNQSVVALSDPACRLWSVKHGLHLLLREKPQHRFFETLDRDARACSS
jgi:hypothetical protein